MQTDQDIIEVETSKATMNVASPCPGRVEKFLVQLNESYLGRRRARLPRGHQRGSARAWASTRRVRRTTKPDSEPQAANGSAADPAHAAPKKQVQPTVRGLPVPANAAGASYMSPRMKARMMELGLHAADLAGLPGSGAAGRVTIQDFEKFIANLERHQTEPRLHHARGRRRCHAPELDAPARHGGPAGSLRPAADPSQDQQPQARPGALCVARAGAGAGGKQRAGRPPDRQQDRASHRPSTSGLPSKPRTACWSRSFATRTKQPAQDLVERYNELIELAHQRKLPADATGGSIATVTNFGTFGLTWATPIPLPEQTLVLGMGAAQSGAHWDAAKGQFVPVMEANLTLSFDHRVLDGGAAGRLLARIAQLFSTPEKL